MDPSVYDDAKNMILENVQLIKSLAAEIDNDHFCECLKKFNDETIDQRLENVEKLIRLKTRQTRIDDITNKAAESSTVAEYESKVDDLLNSENKRRSNVKTTIEYKKLKQLLLREDNTNTVHDDEDINMAGIVETGGNIASMYDPWSKMLMMNPVRNIKCGHHYDRDSVNSIIKNNISVRCPVVGCGSEYYIQPCHLEDNFELLREIRAFKAEQDGQESDDE